MRPTDGSPQPGQIAGMAGNVPAPQLPGGTVAPPIPAPPRRGIRAGLSDQLGIDTMLRSLVRNYLIPVETNTIWYVLGGVLGIAILMEFLTGTVLLFNYTPDAAHAYQSTRSMLDSRGWSIILNYHYFLSYLIFGLVMVHMMRVFVSGAYRATKKGLWQVGVGLASLVFAISITGETLHWDERGFAVPWHVGEFLEALRLQSAFNYVHKNLLNVDFATSKLQAFYILHIVILPALLILAMVLHYFLIKQKRISLPFWHRASGRTSPFSSHMKAWAVWGGIILGGMFLASILVSRGAGPAPQNLAISPYYGAHEGPGGLGTTPTFPISWTHGMNRFVSIAFGWEPDIWGTVLGMLIMLGALVAIPWLDRGRTEPVSWREAFDLRKRGWAFAAVVIFWGTMIIGIVTNAVTPVG